MPTFRPLKAEEVECRIGNVSKQGKGLSLLLYKDARTDMSILDETVGAENWQCRYYECKGILFCSIGIFFGKREEWVWKDNAGAPSNMEAEKGNASDAMKRAGFCWGIGRELYSAPFIWVDAKDCNLTQNNGKWQCFDTFSVNHMEVKDGRITELQIINEKTRKIVFSRGSKKAEPPTPAPKASVPPKRVPTEAEVEEMKAITAAIGNKSAVWAAFQANGIEGARGLLAAKPTNVELFDKDQEF